MRKLILLAAVLLCTALTAQAQVAAPTLAPLVRGYTTANPAAQQWGAPSHVGVAYGTGSTEAKFTDASGTAKIAEGSAHEALAQLRWVGSAFSAGLEQSKVRMNYDMLDSLGGGRLVHMEDLSQQAALAGQIGDMLALGVGYEKLDHTDLDDSTDTKHASTLPVAGASLKLGEVFYIGGAFGTENIDITQVDLATTARISVSTDRSVQRLGVAYQQMFNNGAVHVELFQEARDSYTLDLTPGESYAEIDMTGYSLEALFGSWLVSYVGQSTDSVDTHSGGTKETWSTDSTQATVGWMPQAGLTLLAKLNGNDTTNTNSANSDKYELKSQTVSLGAAVRF